MPKNLFVYRLFVKLFYTPFIAFFMVLFWAVLFGDSLYYIIKNNMIEEWIICMVIYIVLVLGFEYGKRRNKK